MTNHDIPGRIKVINPSTGEYEEGSFCEDGVFIGDSVELDLLSERYSFEPRVMILGRSSVKNFCKIGYGSVIVDSHIFKADVGRNVTVGPGSAIIGPLGAGRAIVDDGAAIGRDSFINDMAYIGAGAVLGDHVTVDRSIIDSDCVIESGSNDHTIEDLELGRFPTHKRTRLTNARVGAGAMIGSDAIVTNFDIPEASVVGAGSHLHRPRRVQRLWS